VRDLGPFWNLDRHAAGSSRRAAGPGSRVFYGDVTRGVRVELTVPDRCPGLSANSLLMLRSDGGWEVFGDDGLLATYDASAVQVTVCGTDQVDLVDRESTLVVVQV
jgi:hypothetical protein